MSNEDIIRAWKDRAYRGSLSEAERGALPANPVEPMELDEEDLDAVGSRGGATSVPCIALATLTLSCAPSCENTVFDGTCDAFTEGCCETRVK